MKKTIKLTFAALAVFSLASCSGDDLFGNGNPLQQNKKTLTVEVEDMIDPLTTRAAYASGATRPTWQVGDQIRVYDDALVKYDVYKYANSTFTSVEDANVIKTPKYALFAPTAGATIKKSGWDYEKKESYVVYSISENWAWAEDSKTDKTQVLYQSNVPQWGEVNVDSETGDLKANLNTLTGAIRLTLKNVPNNIEAIQIEAYEDKEGNKPAQIAGDFKAVIETIEGAQTNAVLVPYKEDDAVAGSNTITVNFTDNSGKWLATQAESQVIIPMIVNTYNLLKINYKAVGDAEFKPARIVESAVNIGRTTLQPIGLANTPLDEFEFAGKDIPALNAALAAQKGSTTLVTITAGKATEVTAEANTIIIPKGMTADINLDLQGGLDGTGYNILNVVSEDGAYAGHLTIQVPGNVDEETGIDSHLQADCKNINIKNVCVNMPNADVTFAGNWYNTDLGTVNHDEAEVLKVNTLTLAKGATVKGIYPNASCCAGNSADADILVAEDAMVHGTGTNGLVLSAATAIDKITVNGTVAGTLNAAVMNLNEKPIVVDVTLGEGSTVGTMETYQDKVLVPAKAKVTTLKAYNCSEVRVRGTVTGLVGDKSGMADKFVKEVGFLVVESEGTVGTANVPGASVYLNRSKTGTAVTTLTMGEAKTLNLAGGHIGTLNAGKDLTFKNKENKGVATSIGTVTGVVGLLKDAADYTSTWGGATDATNTSATATNGKEIWTASQLVKYLATATAVEVKLNANIDLGENTVAAPKAKLGVVFDGNNKKISGGKITAAASVGLFAALTTNGEVKNLLIDGITINQTKTGTATTTVYAVGALAAVADGGKVTGVNVKNATLTNANWVVGGLIGEIKGDVAIDGTKTKDAMEDANTYSTVAAEITGKNMLGGLVGQITTGNVTINNYMTNATFEVTEELDAKKTNKKNFGTVAPYVGTALAGSLTAKDAKIKDTDWKYAQRLDPCKFDKNYQQTTEQVNGDYVIKNYYFVGHKEIGYVSASAFTLTIGTTAAPVTVNVVTDTTVDKKADVNKAGTNADKLNQYLLDSQYAD